jgi:hypothetical protein
MIHLGKAGDHQKVGKDKEYPWPCESKPDRKIMIFDDDILTRSSLGVFTKHTGICCCGINIPESDIVEVFDDQQELVMGGMADYLEHLNKKND